VVLCGLFTQHSTWRQVHTFSQPLVVDSPDEPVVSTPMRPAYILRLDLNGQGAMAPMRWGLSGVNTLEVSAHPRARGETIDMLRRVGEEGLQPSQ